MGTVSNPASFSSIRAAYASHGSSTSFRGYTRGAGIVTTPAGISTDVNSLRMSQFNGVSDYTNVSASGGTTLQSSASPKGSYTIGSTTITGAGGTGSYTYSAPSLVAGSTTSPSSSISLSQSGNIYTASATNTNSGGSTTSATWRVTVSDGTTSATQDIVVNWN